MRKFRLISGGQTGADRGGLEFALDHGFEHGGYCPKNRRSEDGRIPERFNFLVECETQDYAERTAKNVADSDVTLIFSFVTSPGSRLTMSMCSRARKPYILIADHDQEVAARKVRDWLKTLPESVATINIAGNRESVFPGIQKYVYNVLKLAYGLA